MTELHRGQLDSLEPDPATSPPDTGHASIDDALLGLADLASAPLSDHYDRLATAHEVLHKALDRADDQPESAESR